MKSEIKNLKSKTPAKRAGMTLFIAIVIMSILLFISFAVVNIAVKSSLFASSGRDSQYAFYAADSGMECALYWDGKFDPSMFDLNGGGPINCNGLTINAGDFIAGTTTDIRTRVGDATHSVFGFLMTPGNPDGPCAIVTVDKDVNTYIKSRGYNTCNMNSLRRVERGVEATY